VPTMVLSETRGLWLFRVVRGGIGSARWLGAEARRASLHRLILSLEPERLKNRLATTRDDPEMERALCEALKLLVVSDVGRRNELLSSKRSK
jgi:hypothetical protein